MAITFDTEKELAEFRRSFRPLSGRPRQSSAISTGMKAKRQPGSRTKTIAYQIRKLIQGHLQQRQTFTANDIADKLPQFNRGSVITTVSKQMKTTYRDIKRTERAGNGPRMIIHFNA